jgi:protoporphyrinogen IX oxidase
MTQQSFKDIFMHWLKALHIIFMVTWFSGLFYLPRLFVYHAMASDSISIERFKIMERKLFFGIMTPGAVLTLLMGLWIMSTKGLYYFHFLWFHVKIALVALLIIYHFYLGYLLYCFKKDKNTHSHVFYRWLNEVPVLFLVGIVILAMVKPWRALA